MGASGMRQTQEEQMQMALAYLGAAAEEMRIAHTAAQPGTPFVLTSTALDAHLRQRAGECPLAFCSYVWLRWHQCLYTIIDTKNAGKFGNFRAYLEFLPVMHRLFCITNAVNYSKFVVCEMRRWKVASEAKLAE